MLGILEKDACLYWILSLKQGKFKSNKNFIYIFKTDCNSKESEKLLFLCTKKITSHRENLKWHVNSEI